MNIRRPTAIRISGIEVAHDRYVSVNGPAVTELPNWGHSVRTHEVEYHLHPAIQFELHYQVPLYVIVHAFNGGQGRLAVGGKVLTSWAAEARGTSLVLPDTRIRVIQTTPLEFLALGIKPALFERLAKRAADHWRGEEDMLKFSDPALSALFAEMRRSMISEPTGTGDYLDALTGAALARLAEWHTEPSSERQQGAETLSPAMVRRLTAVTEERLDGPIRVSALAEESGLSRSHFSRAFAQSFGMTSRRYIISRRIARARGLLTETDLSATEIAMRCGFSNPSHLTTAFRHELGLTPTEYRKALAGGSPAGGSHPTFQ